MCIFQLGRDKKRVDVIKTCCEVKHNVKEDHNGEDDETVFYTFMAEEFISEQYRQNKN